MKKSNFPSSKIPQTRPSFLPSSSSDLALNLLQRHVSIHPAAVACRAGRVQKGTWDESKCLANASFANCIKTLEVCVCRLKLSLVWLELHRTEITPVLLTAINEHSTLETAAIESLPLSLTRTTLSLDKVLAHSEGWHDVMDAHQCRIRILCLRATKLRLSLPWEILLIPDLRELDISSSDNIDSLTLYQLNKFISHHPKLTKIAFSSAWKHSSLCKPHISKFLGALQAQPLRDALSSYALAQALMESHSDIGFDRWEVTSLTFCFKRDLSGNSLVKTLPLAGTMFSKVSSLNLRYHACLIHVDTFVGLLSKHFPNLQTFSLFFTSEFLTWTPLLIPTNEESQNSMEYCVAHMQWLMWHLFQRLPLLLNIYAHEETQSSEFSRFSATYDFQPRRDFSRAVFEMKMVYQATGWKSINDPQKFSYQGFVVL
ncbi:hypothetical protein C8J56DRAFT_1043616 [Mycena floridula]|nr:hypothetical protein C8J56DRAFT_1043616 [Mycena floridula]